MGIQFKGRTGFQILSLYSSFLVMKMDVLISRVHCVIQIATFAKVSPALKRRYLNLFKAKRSTCCGWSSGWQQFTADVCTGPLIEDYAVCLELRSMESQIVDGSSEDPGVLILQHLYEYQEISVLSEGTFAVAPLPNRNNNQALQISSLHQMLYDVDTCPSLVIYMYFVLIFCPLIEDYAGCVELRPEESQLLRTAMKILVFSYCKLVSDLLLLFPPTARYICCCSTPRGIAIRLFGSALFVRLSDRPRIYLVIHPLLERVVFITTQIDLASFRDKLWQLDASLSASGSPDCSLTMTLILS
ncbi:hypothetical protein ACH5RR_024797 [Cinchona calisaya]|uniref:Uncharacterized protein n=1 Tax=Cinchona calisaya TaxID=153742 RepID=A0ABD2Z1A6_9GENT